jgi:hypothetical protein
MMFDWAYRRRLPEECETVILDKPALQIHGTNDWLLPIQLTNPDIRIEGGGHLIGLTHSEKVNEMIAHFVEELSTGLMEHQGVLKVFSAKPLKDSVDFAVSVDDSNSFDPADAELLNLYPMPTAIAEGLDGLPNFLSKIVNAIVVNFHSKFLSGLCAK